MASMQEERTQDSRESRASASRFSGGRIASCGVHSSASESSGCFDSPSGTVRSAIGPSCSFSKMTASEVTSSAIASILDRVQGDLDFAGGAVLLDGASAEPERVEAVVVLAPGVRAPLLPQRQLLEAVVGVGGELVPD